MKKKMSSLAKSLVQVEAGCMDDKDKDDDDSDEEYDENDECSSDDSYTYSHAEEDKEVVEEEKNKLVPNGGKMNVVCQYDHIFL